jgi:hypothetical protein
VYSVEIWTVWKRDQKPLERYQKLCWRRMKNTSWTDSVKNKEVLNTVKEYLNILHTTKRKEANWFFTSGVETAS